MNWFRRVEDKLDRALAALDRLTNTVQRGVTMANAQIDDVIKQLRSITSLDDSILAYVQSVPSLISQAVAAAQASGATPEQLAALTGLTSDLTSKATSIAAAITANTPAAPPAA